MDTNKLLVFYIVREKTEDAAKDFPNLIYELRNSYIFVDIVENSPVSVSLSGAATYKSSLEYLTADIPEQFAYCAFCARLTISSEDYLTFNKLRSFLSRGRDFFRIFSNQLHSYLPQDSDLISLEFGTANIKTFDALKKYSLQPVYFSQEKHIFYAINSADQKIHIVNPYLLEYIWDKIIPENSLSELSYPVAKSLELFSAAYDKELIPKNFYEYYGKSTKIINNSHFNIDHQERKVFVKPLIFEFNVERGSFYTYTGKDGGSLLSMDKIRPGETLDMTLTRVVKDDLKISPNFIAAYVSPKIEFDRDRDGILTPRLIVLVYVDKINDKTWALQMSQTGWKSPGGQTPKVNLNPDFKDNQS